MDRIIVRPRGPLSGRVAIGGAKNSALKLMAATCLAEGTYQLDNVPDISDVTTMTELLSSMGMTVTRLRPHQVEIHHPPGIVPEAPYELVERMRASINVLGPLVARYGRARVALPGGDDFGPRPIDMHVRGLEQLGARFETAHGYIEATADRLVGASLVLEFPSVGATENALTAAVLARGTTVIDNAAREPEIGDLAAFLIEMGAQISGVGTSTLTIAGVHELAPARHTVIPDRIETATFLAAVGVAGGQVTLDGARADHLDMLLQKLGQMGMTFVVGEGSLEARAPDRLASADISTLPYPGLATDYKPLFVAMLATADGVGIVTENIFSGRFRYIDELVRMGADIRTEGHHAVVRGQARLSGAPVRAHDIRAGAALVVAALRADGETVVADAHHLERGYEGLVDKLTALGANIAWA